MSLSEALAKMDWQGAIQTGEDEFRQSGSDAERCQMLSAAYVGRVKELINQLWDPSAEVRKYIARAIELDPNNGEAWLLRGTYIDYFGRPIEETRRLQVEYADRAIAIFTRVLSADPNDVRTLLLRSEAYMGKARGVSLGKLSSAIQNFEISLALDDAQRAVSVDPSLQAALCWLGQVHWASGRELEGIQIMTDALNLGEDGELYRRRGRMYASLAFPISGDSPKIRAASAKIHETSTDESSLSLAEAQESCLADFQRAIELGVSDAYSDRGRTYAKLHRADEALLDFARYIACIHEKQGTDGWSLFDWDVFQIAESLLKSKDIAGAFDVVEGQFSRLTHEELASQDGFTWSIHIASLLRAHIEAYRGEAWKFQLEPVAEFIARLLRVCSDTMRRTLTEHLIRTIESSRPKRCRRGTRAWEEWMAAADDWLVRLDPIEGLTTKAQRLFDEENYSSAVVEYQKLAEVAPENQKVLAAIGQCFERLRRPEVAVEWYERALAQGNGPTRSDILGARAELLRTLKRWHEAIQDYSGALPESVDRWRISDWYRGRADCFEQVGELESAFRDWESLEAMRPDDPSISSHKERLRRAMDERTSKAGQSSLEEHQRREHHASQAVDRIVTAWTHVD